MNKICTSIEQSEKLIELGIDVKTADMDYIQFANMPKEYDCVVNIWNNGHEEDWIPAWSLSALLELIPNWTMDKTDKLNLTCNLYDHCESCYEDLVDAAFEMVCWLLENNKI